MAYAALSSALEVFRIVNVAAITDPEILSLCDDAQTVLVTSFVGNEPGIYLADKFNLSLVVMAGQQVNVPWIDRYYS